MNVGSLLAPLLFEAPVSVDLPPTALLISVEALARVTPPSPRQFGARASELIKGVGRYAQIATLADLVLPSIVAPAVVGHGYRCDKKIEPPPSHQVALV